MMMVLKQLLACVLITALLAPGCSKKKAPEAGSGEGSAPAAGGTGNGGSGAETPVAQGPATTAAGALASSTLQANADIAKAFAATSPAAQAAQLDKLLDAAIASATSSARDRSWDPASVITKVGTERAKLFAWVREQTALVPYAGSLRGAVGVMMDRVGNSLDRSLLLADLLARAGGEVQLAHATLDAAQAEQLAVAWQKAPRPAFPTTAEDAATTENLIAALGGDRVALEKRLAAQAAARSEIAAKARAQIAAQAGTLAKTIEASPVAASIDAAVLADHWWVQVKDGDAWSELDPTQPGPGQTIAPAAETIARDAVPEGMRHTLALRVIGEVWHGDAREEATLVEHAFVPADFFGQRVTVTAMALDMPDAEKLDGEKDRAAAARNALVAQTEWAPMIIIGVTPVVHFSVTDGGELFDLTDPNQNTNRLARAVQRATKNGVGGATEMLEGLPDGSDQAPPKPAAGPHSGFTAEWLEIEVRTPNAAPRIVRRPIFDALGAAANRGTAKPVNLAEAQKFERGLALHGVVEILAQLARIPNGFEASRIAKYLTAAKPSMIAVVKNGGRNPPDALAADVAKALPPPSDLDELAHVRFAWSPADKVFVDQLDVLTSWRRLASIGGTLRAHSAIDIITNGVGSWGTPADARSARLAQGIADTVAESVLKPCVATPCVRGPNTSDAYVGATDWALVTDASSPAVTGLPTAARAIATSDLATGYALVAARSGRPATWWRVRLDTGETLGQAALGGSEFVEYLTTANLLKVLGIELGAMFCYFGASGLHAVGCAVGVLVAGVGSFVAAPVLSQVLNVAGILIGGLSTVPLP